MFVYVAVIARAFTLKINTTDPGALEGCVFYNAVVMKLPFYYYEA